MGAPVLRYPWAGGSPFGAALKLNRTPAAPTLQTFTVTVTADIDTRIVEGSGVDYSAETLLYVWGKAGSLQRSILRFKFPNHVFPSAGSYTITAASLTLYYERYLDSDTYDPAGRYFNVKYLTGTPGKTWVEAAEWDHYDNAAAHWTGGDGDGDADDGATGNMAGTASSLVVPAHTHAYVDMVWNDPNFITLITAAIDDATAPTQEVNLIVYDSDETGSGNGIGCFYSSEQATHKPTLSITYTRTPPAPDPDVMKIKVYKGYPTLEELDSDVTVNARSFGYKYGPIAIHTFDTCPAGTTFKVIIDTKSMVDYGPTKMFYNSDAHHAYSVEFVIGDDLANDCKYWCLTALGVPELFNTGGTEYFISTPIELAADTDYELWMYGDAAQHAAKSTNWRDASAAAVKDTGLFLEDFAANTANFAAFIAAYTDWEQDTSSTPNNAGSGTSGSVLSIKGANSAGFEGIRTKATTWAEDKYHLLIRMTTTIAAGNYAGMMDVTGMDGIAGTADENGMIIYNYSSHQYYGYNAGTAIPYAVTYPNPPWIVEIRRYGTQISFVTERKDPDNQPDSWGVTEGMVRIPIGAEDTHVVIGSTGTTTTTVDFVLCYLALEHPPVVKAPSVTYRGPGCIFTEDNDLNFPFDTAFTKEDGTVLYCSPDYKSQLTAIPGYSIQLAVSVPSASTFIYCYVGHAAITSAHDHWIEGTGANNPYSEYDDFESIAGWTAGFGTWAQADIIEPVIRTSITGNVGSVIGQSWTRMPCPFAWNGKFYVIANAASFEYMAAWWPVPCRGFCVYEIDAIGKVLGPPVIVQLDPDQAGQAHSGWVDSVFVDGTYGSGAIYAQVSCANSTIDSGIKIWKCSGDPMVPSNWSYNATVLLDKTWLAANGLSDGVSSMISYMLYKRGSTWYVFMTGCDVSANYTSKIFYTSTTDNDPITWANTDFEAVGAIQLAAIFPVKHLEDMGIAQCVDVGSEATYIYFTTAPSVDAAHPYDFIGYIKLDETSHTFPAAGHWLTGVADPPAGLVVDWEHADWSYARNGSPRIYDNKSVDGYVYLFNYGQCTDDSSTVTAFTRWIPNWVQVTRGTDYLNFDKFELADTPAHLQPSTPKYRQSLTASYYWTHKDGTNYDDIDYAGEVTASGGKAGLCYRQNLTNQTGYFACLDTGTVTTQYVRLYKYSGITLTEIGTAYTLPAFPEPGGCGYLHATLPWRLRVVAYGTSHKVYFSKWGEDWILAKSETDVTYNKGQIGAGSHLGTVNLKNLCLKKYVSVESSLGEAEWTYFGSVMPANF